MPHFSLTDSQVALIRMTKHTDLHWADLWNLDKRTIQRARVGDSHAGNVVRPVKRKRRDGRKL